MNKIDSQTIHSIRRAKERYGIDLTPGDLGKIAKAIRSGKSEFFKRESLRITKHIVIYMGNSFLVAYDGYRKSVCSILPKEEIEKEPK